jgi:hypothetical protein
MAIKYTKIFHCKILQNLPKLWTFGLKIYHLATLLETRFLSAGWQRLFLCTNRCIRVATRVARCFIFKPKLPISVNFGRCFLHVGIVYDHLVFYGLLVYFMVIRYILWPFGTLLPILVWCTKKNLATLVVAIVNYALVFMNLHHF